MREQKVLVSVEDYYGKAYTYVWRGEESLIEGDKVLCKGAFEKDTVKGIVIDDDDTEYDGYLKEVLQKLDNFSILSYPA